MIVASWRISPNEIKDNEDNCGSDSPCLILGRCVVWLVMSGQGRVVVL